jgi:3-methyl-2-oxobutanoate hydroxymethyltransferase
VTQGNGWPEDRRITVADLQAATERGERWTMLTSYDAMTAGLFEESGVHALLVGDTAGMVVYGYETTVPATLDLLVPLAAAVVRGTRRALVVGDLPFGSYQLSAEQGLASAVRYMQEAQVQAVKLEGGRRVLPQVEAMVAAGIPVMGHLGLTPQSVNVFGGWRVQGRGEAAEELADDARALEAAGAFALVLEAVPSKLGARVADELRIPVIGIGAGPGVDAQVLVWQDLAGLTPYRVPKFAKRYADLRGVLGGAVADYVREVADGTYPGEEHSYS